MSRNLVLLLLALIALLALVYVIVLPILMDDHARALNDTAPSETESAAEHNVVGEGFKKGIPNDGDLCGNPGAPC